MLDILAGWGLAEMGTWLDSGEQAGVRSLDKGERTLNRFTHWKWGRSGRFKM